jgi:hypothetical protein
MIINVFGIDQRDKISGRFHPRMILIPDLHSTVKPGNRKFQIREVLFEISSHNLTKYVPLKSVGYVSDDKIWED